MDPIRLVLTALLSLAIVTGLLCIAWVLARSLTRPAPPAAAELEEIRNRLATPVEASTS